MAVHKEKLNYLDIAKGLGMIIVVLAHIDTGDNPLCAWIGSFCMPIFFFVSGALLFYLDSWKNDKPLSIIVKRIKGIMYPYFSFSALVVLFYLFLRVVFKQGSFSNIIEIVKSTVTLSGYEAMWFMPVLFFAELMVLFWLYFSKNNRVAEWIGLAFFMTASVICWCTINSGAIDRYTTGGFLFYKVARTFIATVFIYAGYLYFEYKDCILKLNKKAVSIFMILIFFGNIFISQPNHFVDFAFVGIVSLPLFWFTGIMVPMSVLYLGEVYSLRCKPLEFYGKNSLTMMATHNPIPVLATVESLYHDFGPTFGRYVDDVVILLIVLIVEVPIILLVNKFLPFVVRWPKKKKS